MLRVALLDVVAGEVAARALDVSGAVVASAVRTGVGDALDACAAAAHEVLREVADAVPPADWLGLMVVAPERTTVEDGVLLTVHDALVARLTGVRATPASYACATGLADAYVRGWSPERLRSSGSRTAPVVETGTVVGELLPGWGLPESLPVVAGAVREQLLVVAAGGLRDGVLTELDDARVLTAASPVAVPVGWVLAAHAAPGLWALTGPPGAEPGLPVSEVLRAARPVEVAVAALVARAVGAHAHLPHASPA